jgi:lipoteichoic acid synthase
MMIKKLSTFSLLFYFLVSLFYMETILRIHTTGKLFSSGLLYSILFSISLAIIFYLICSFFQGKVSCIFSVVLLTISAVVFSSQLIYFKFFKTFYSMYSAGNAGQVFQFWRDIYYLTLRNFWILALLFIPVFLIIPLRKKVFNYSRINWTCRSIMICTIFLFHLIGITVIHVGSRAQHSPYDLYFDSSYPNLSVERLGLITTMRLDLQRLALGWSPSLRDIPVDLPVFSPEEPDPQETPPEEVKYDYNVLNIDFESLIANEKDEILRNMHRYFQSVPPTQQNEYTGKYKDYNLIFITAEGFSPYAIHKEVTPTLYKLVNEGYNFTNFYTPLWGVSTSDGEYVACTGLLPKHGVWSFFRSGSNYMPFVMGNQLKGLGYKTVAYHNHTYSYYRRDVSHPNMGYDYKGVGNGLNVKKVWPASDLEMMEKTVDEYINNQPFHAYYMTVSGHMLYTFTGNSMSFKNRNLVQHLPYSEGGRAYLACQIEFDRAMEYLLNQLEEAGIADKTLIAISADHYPYGLEEKDLNELAGRTLEKNFELYKNTFILYTKGMDPVTIDKPSSSLDIIPTLSNLLGLEYDSRLLMGRDIFSNSSPLVVFLNKSYITDRGRYNAVTGEFTPNPGVYVDENYVNMISALVDTQFFYSAKILDTDYYRKILKN